MDTLKLEMWAVWLAFEELNSHALENQQALLTTVLSSVFLNDDHNMHVYSTTQKPNISFRHNFHPVAKVYYLKVEAEKGVLFGEDIFAKETDNEHREV